MFSHYIDLIFYKAYAELRVEVTRSYLGIVWWVMEPVLYMGAFYVVFDMVLKRGGEGFVPFLLTGLVTWKWFASTLMQAMSSIDRNRGLISQVYLPKYLFPLIVVLTTSVKFLVVFTLLLCFILIYGYDLSLNWLFLPLVILVQFLLLTGVSILVAACVPLVPDIRLIIDNGMIMLFFLSGVFFDLSRVGGTIGTLLGLNPMAEVIIAYRSILLHGQPPEWAGLSYVLLVSVLLMSAGLAIIRRFDRVYPKFL